MKKSKIVLSINRGLAENEAHVRFSRYCKNGEYRNKLKTDLKYFSWEQLHLVAMANTTEEMIRYINADLKFWKKEYGMTSGPYEIGNASKSMQFLIFMEAKEEIDTEDVAKDQEIQDEQIIPIREREIDRSIIRRLRNTFWRIWYRIPGQSHFKKSSSNSIFKYKKGIRKGLKTSKK